MNTKSKIITNNKSEKNKNIQFKESHEDIQHKESYKNIQPEDNQNEESLRILKIKNLIDAMLYKHDALELLMLMKVRKIKMKMMKIEKSNRLNFIRRNFIYSGCENLIDKMLFIQNALELIKREEMKIEKSKRQNVIHTGCVEDNEDNEEDDDENENENENEVEIDAQPMYTTDHRTVWHCPTNNFVYEQDENENNTFLGELTEISKKYHQIIFDGKFYTVTIKIDDNGKYTDLICCVLTNKILKKKFKQI